jgi:hypothetical protein
MGCRVDNVYPIVNPRTGDIEIGCFSYAVEPRDVPHLALYDRAHRLMPPNYSFESCDSAAHVQYASRVLSGSDATEDQVLGALAVLGHSPCEESFVVLGRWARNDPPYGSVARFALAECAGIAGLFDEPSAAC